MESKAFKEIYYQFYEKLYRIAFRLVNDVESARDMVQETYLSLWDKRHGLGIIDRPEAYAIAILRNLCLNHIRNKKDRINTEDNEDIPEKELLTIKLENKNEAELMIRLIEALPAQQRQIINLRHCEGYTYEEIESITGLDVYHIRVIVSRARKILRLQFERIINDDYYRNKKIN